MCNGSSLGYLKKPVYKSWYTKVAIGRINYGRFGKFYKVAFNA